MNTRLVESVVALIGSLSVDERRLLEEKLYLTQDNVSTIALMRLAECDGSLDFLNSEPDLYSLEDGEPLLC